MGAVPSLTALCWLQSETIIMASVWLVLMSRRLVRHQSKVNYRPRSSRWKDSARIVPRLKTTVSSAKDLNIAFGSDSEAARRLLMNILNRTGPSAVPCGTPEIGEGCPVAVIPSQFLRPIFSHVNFIHSSGSIICSMQSNFCHSFLLKFPLLGFFHSRSFTMIF